MSFFRKLIVKSFFATVALFSVYSPSTKIYAEEKKQTVRKFNDVLKDLLNEFSYDLKTNQVQGVKSVAVRRVTLSESIPKSYESYLENLTLERIQKFSKIKAIQCTMCRVKKSMVERGKLIVTMPINNQTELDALSSQLGIETWLDATLLYQQSGMVLAYNAFDARTKELLWTKTYNSEDLNKNLDEAALNSASPDKPLLLEDDPSHYVVAVSAGWYLVANVKKPSNMLGINIRASEQFNNKKSEIGGLVAIIVNPNILVSNYASNQDPSASDEVTINDQTQVVKPFDYGLALFATYHHNFGNLEATDKFRWGLHGGVGGIYAPGYLTFTGKAGPTFKFGKHFFVEMGVNYSAPTTLTLKEQFQYKTKGGVGGDATFGIYF